jgi:hypothetical protein
MQVAEYQDGAIALFLKRFVSGYFQINLPCGDHGAAFAGNPFGFSKTLCRSIAADHIQPSLTNQNPIVTLTARQIQNRARDTFPGKEILILQHQR